MRARFIFVLLVVFLFPCAASAQEETMQVSVGQEFSLTMESNATTGFQWRFAEPLDESAVQFVDKKYVPKPNPQAWVGVGGNEVWTFKAVKKGEAVISLEYDRAWEKAKPANRVKIVRVIAE